MGGRGASSGISDRGERYGTEYKSVLKVGNIKFVKSNKNTSVKTPMETMTRGRVYVMLKKNGDLQAITYYDNQGKRKKTIDLGHAHNGIKPHTHHGYEHNENDGRGGAANLTPKEKRMVARVRKIWENRSAK